MLIDIIFAVIIVLACWKGFQKGLIVAVFSILAFIIGIAAALKLSSIVAGWLKDATSISAKWLPFVSFLVVFIGVVLLVRLGAKLIEKTFETAMMGWANRLGGVVFYAMLYTIIFSVFLFYVQQVQLLKPDTIAASQTYSFIQPWGPKVIDGFGKVIPIFKDMFADLETFFGSVASSAK